MSELDSHIRDVLEEIGEIDGRITYSENMSGEEIKGAAKRKDVDAIPTLVAMLLKNTHDPEKISVIAWALGEIRSEKALPALMAILGKVEDPSAREKIVWAMGEIKNPRIFGTLAKILRDSAESFEVKWAAALAMKSIGRDAEVAPLIEGLKKIMIQKAMGK